MLNLFLLIHVVPSIFKKEIKETKRGRKLYLCEEIME
jgi:hypothetical protein